MASLNEKSDNEFQNECDEDPLNFTEANESEIEDECDFCGFDTKNCQCQMKDLYKPNFKSTVVHLNELNELRKKHVKVPKIHICNFCQKTFKLKSILNRHLVVCAERKGQHLKHQCEFCEKSFWNLSTLNKHTEGFHKNLVKSDQS